MRGHITMAGCLLATLAAMAGHPVSAQQRVAGPGGHQFTSQLLRPAGGPVIPFFEGWYQNPEGTYELTFGYWNVNTEEVIDIPLGRENFIEPVEFDGVQPTHFLPVPDGDRRFWGVFTVTVPEDFGDRDVVWTLLKDGRTFSVPRRLTHAAYELEAWDQPGRNTAAPVLRFDAQGPEGMAQGGITAPPAEVRVGDRLPVTTWTSRDNPHRVDARPINLRWFKHQGPGAVTFFPLEHQVEVDGDGRALTEAIFTEPGDYVLRVVAYNIISDFEFFCCWTNGYVMVTVTP